MCIQKIECVNDEITSVSCFSYFICIIDTGIAIIKFYSSLRHAILAMRACNPIVDCDYRYDIVLQGTFLSSERVFNGYS